MEAMPTQKGIPEPHLSSGEMVPASADLPREGANAVEADPPNLTPYQPNGWSGEIVVDKKKDTTNDATELYPTDTLYIDWALSNSGGSTSVRFHSALYVDGVEKAYWYTDPPLQTNYYAYVKDYSLGSLPAGSHTLQIVIDYKSEIAESNEGDNSFTKTIVIKDPGGSLTPAQDIDKDGVPDIVDPLPLDPAISSLTPFDEVEFNNNLGQANVVPGGLPLLVSGAIAKGTNYYLDIDYFSFKARAGDKISVLAYSGTVNDTGTAISFETSPFTPRLSVLDSSGNNLIGMNITGLGLSSGVSINIPKDGDYYVQVSDTSITASDYYYPYVLSIFIDSDKDGLSNDLETALGTSSQGGDSDLDGLGDYDEVFSFSLKPNGIKVPATASSAAWWDMDKDGKPNWRDTDSDGDGIEDGVEKVADFDTDKLPAFVDLNANGTALPDAKEVGKSPEHPNDADVDGIADYQDLDIDGDGIPNAADVAPYNAYLPKVSAALGFFRVASQVNGSVQLGGVVIPGKSLFVYGKGITQQFRVVMPVPGGAVILTPKNVGSGFLEVTAPQAAVDGVLIILGNNQRSEDLPIQVRRLDSDPILTSLSSSQVKPNETLTLFGKNLSNDQVSVIFENPKVSVTASAKAALDSVQVTVPQEAAGGRVRVEVGARTSNALDLHIRRNITVSVALPAALKIPANKISLIAGGKRNTLQGNYTVQVPTLNQDIAFLNCSVTLGTNDYALLYEGVALPGTRNLKLSPLSTAVKMVFFPLGYSVTLPRDKWQPVIATLEKVPAVVDLANYITQLLVKDIRALQKFQDAGLNTKLQAAIVAGSKAVAQQVKAWSAIQESFEAPLPLQGLEPVITPTEDQFGVALTVKDPADITVSNGTKLFASVEVTAKDKKKTLIQRHARSELDPLLLGPSGWIGRYTSYFRSTKDYKTAGRDSHFEVITAGTLDPQPDTSKTYLRYQLILKQVLEGFTAPLVDKFILGPIFDQSYDSETVVAFIKAFISTQSLNRMASAIASSPNNIGDIVYDVVIKQFTNALTNCNFPPNPTSSCYLLIEHLVNIVFKKALTFDKVASMVASSLGKEIGATLIPIYGQIRAALRTADRVSVGSSAVASIYDMFVTPGLITFDVDFPLEITEVKPLCLSKTDTVNQIITIVGKGLHPYKDEDGYDIRPKIYIDSHEGYVVNWSDGEGDLQEIYVSFGNISLPDGEYPLRVVHQGQTIFSNEKIRVFTDGLVLDRIDPNKGAEGDKVVFYGCGIGPSWAGPGSPVYDPNVYFTADGGKTVTSPGVKALEETILNVVVPEKAITGPVYVMTGQKKSNALPFTVEQSEVVITYGDCGAATDDTFALFVDGEPKSSMSGPATPFPVTMNLTPGKHEVRLVGITAPDAIGTYCISFSSNVRVVSGPPLSGDDLTAGVAKTWLIEVTTPAKSPTLEPENIEGLILWDLPG